MSDLVIVILVVIPVIVGTAVIFYSNTDMNNTFWQRRITELEAENARLKEEIMGSLDNKTCSNCKYLDRQRQLCTNQMICLNYGFWKARF